MCLIPSINMGTRYHARVWTYTSRKSPIPPDLGWWKPVSPATGWSGLPNMHWLVARKVRAAGDLHACVLNSGWGWVITWQAVVHHQNQYPKIPNIPATRISAKVSRRIQAKISLFLSFHRTRWERRERAMLGRGRVDRTEYSLRLADWQKLRNKVMASRRCEMEDPPASWAGIGKMKREG